MRRLSVYLRSRTRLTAVRKVANWHSDLCLKSSRRQTSGHVCCRCPRSWALRQRPCLSRRSRRYKNNARPTVADMSDVAALYAHKHASYLHNAAGLTGARRDLCRNPMPSMAHISRRQMERWLFSITGSRTRHLPRLRSPKKAGRSFVMFASTSIRWTSFT